MTNGEISGAEARRIAARLGVIDPLAGRSAVMPPALHKRIVQELNAAAECSTIGYTNTPPQEAP